MHGAALLLALLAPLLLCVAALAELVVTPVQPEGVYNAGQQVAWTVRWNGPNPPDSVEFIVKRDFLEEISRRTASLQDGAILVSESVAPGHTAQLEVIVGDAKEVSEISGIIVAPDQVEPTAPPPEDFDAFWAEQVERIKAVPANARFTPVKLNVPDVDYGHVVLDGIDGTKVRGQLARPSRDGKFPAILIPQWAGVYALEPEWVLGRAQQGWLVLNILAHDLPINREPEFYQRQEAGPLANYPGIGNDDRLTSYFLRMYLSCYQAAEYLASRDDWNGEVLVVAGGSQGGQQALVTAAMHPKVTAVIANVPAGCDMLGPAHPTTGRRPGYPMWYWNVGDKNPEAVRAASRYFDVVNFAPRIDVPTLVGAGLEDDVCPPAGIVAAANRMAGPVELLLMPNAGHQNEYNSQALFYQREWQWLAALQAGEAPPVRE